MTNEIKSIIKEIEEDLIKENVPPFKLSYNSFDSELQVNFNGLNYSSYGVLKQEFDEVIKHFKQSKFNMYREV